MEDGSFCADCLVKFIPTKLGNWVRHVTVSDGIDKAYSGWNYEEGIHDAIHNLKYSDRARLGTELGTLLGRELSSEISGSIDLITAVPLHPVKLRERGYNQARFIALGLGKYLNIPVHDNLIYRRKYTESQTMLSQSARLENVHAAFEVKKNVDNLKIGLVDDVLTTGSTISSCAQALKSKGAQVVVAVTCSTPSPEE